MGGSGATYYRQSGPSAAEEERDGSDWKDCYCEFSPCTPVPGQGQLIIDNYLANANKYGPHSIKRIDCWPKFSKTQNTKKKKQVRWMPYVRLPDFTNTPIYRYTFFRDIHPLTPYASFSPFSLVTQTLYALLEVSYS